MTLQITGGDRDWTQCRKVPRHGAIINLGFYTYLYPVEVMQQNNHTSHEHSVRSATVLIDIMAVFVHN